METVIWLTSLFLLVASVIYDIKTGCTRRGPVLMSYLILTVMNLLCKINLNINFYFPQ